MTVTPLFRKIRVILSHAGATGVVRQFALMLGAMVLETLSIGLVIPAIALMVDVDPAGITSRAAPFFSALGQPTEQQLVVAGMLLLVAVYFAKTVFLAFVVWRQFTFAFGLQARLSQRLFATYLLQPYAFHLQRNSAQLVVNAVNEVTLFTFNGVLPTLLLLSEGLVTLGIVTLLFLVEPLGTAITITVLGAAAALFHRTIRTGIDRVAVARQHHDAARMQHLQQGLAGAKEVKLLGRENYFIGQYDRHNAESARLQQHQQTLLQLPRLWLEMLAVVALAVLVLTAIARGQDIATTLPTLGLFAAAAFRLMPSANRVLASVQQVRYAAPVIDTLYDEFGLLDSESQRPSGGPVAFTREIELRDVSFTYAGAVRPAVEHLSLTIRKGECIGFVGSSGAGKSTVVDIILGLLPPTRGEVRVDGRDIRGGIRGWQDNLGYVPQTIYLIDDTLRRNVAFGLDDDRIDEAAVLRAIRAAQLEDFVASSPDGLDTMVGERGVRLSGGQRQRIGIARALYLDPPVLVLDEATSALDTATEAGVMDAVLALHLTKTIIIVAHRLSTVAQCDRLYRLEDGRCTPGPAAVSSPMPLS